MNPIRFSPRHRLLALAAAAVAVLTLPLGAVSAAAAPASPVAKYVALGDSYAAGQGAGGYADACLRSPESYAALLDATPRLNLLRQPACSGATIAQVAATQLSEINRGTTLVTITAGANDLGIAQVYAACAADPMTMGCQQALGTAYATIPSVGPSMAALIAAVQQRSPNATVVVTGYPRPFGDDFAMGVPVAGYINQAVDALNAQVAGAVMAQPGAGMSVRFVPVSFGANTIGGGADPWIGADIADPVAFLHPNAMGYAAYRDAILLALN